MKRVSWPAGGTWRHHQGTGPRLGNPSATPCKRLRRHAPAARSVSLLSQYPPGSHRHRGPLAWSDPAEHDGAPRTSCWRRGLDQTACGPAAPERLDLVLRAALSSGGSPPHYRNAPHGPYVTTTEYMTTCCRSRAMAPVGLVVMLTPTSYHDQLICCADQQCTCCSMLNVQDPFQEESVPMWAMIVTLIGTESP